MPSLANTLFQSLKLSLDPSNTFTLPEDWDDDHKYQRICEEISQKLIEVFKLKEIWYFNPLSEHVFNEDKSESHAMCKLAGELPVDNSYIARGLYDSGHEVSKFRVIGCYCDIHDELTKNPIPRSYVHVTPRNIDMTDAANDSFTEYEEVISNFIPYDWESDFRNYIIQTLGYSIATVTPLTYYFEFNDDPNISTTDERVRTALSRAGYKVSKYYIIPCKAEKTL